MGLLAGRGAADGVGVETAGTVIRAVGVGVGAGAATVGSGAGERVGVGAGRGTAFSGTGPITCGVGVGAGGRRYSDTCAAEGAASMAAGPARRRARLVIRVRAAPPMARAG